MMMFSLMKPFTVKVYWTIITEISAYLSKPFNIKVFFDIEFTLHNCDVHLHETTISCQYPSYCLYMTIFLKNRLRETLAKNKSKFSEEKVFFL